MTLTYRFYATWDNNFDQCTWWSNCLNCFAVCGREHVYCVARCQRCVVYQVTADVRLHVWGWQKEVELATSCFSPSHPWVNIYFLSPATPSWCRQSQSRQWQSRQRQSRQKSGRQATRGERNYFTLLVKKL